MSYVHPPFTFTPPARTDDESWTQVGIWESATANGTFTLIETQNLDPVDPPGSPTAHVITVELAALENGWYRFQPLDADGDPGVFSEPVLSPAGSSPVFERLRRMTAADHEPLLSDADLAEILQVARVGDADGRLPSHASWTPTYDIHRAAAAGWDAKAAKAASDFRFEEDNQVFHRDQVFRACRQMADRYNRSMRVVTGL